MTPDEEAKARFHFRAEVLKVLNVFRIHGLDVHIQPATVAIEDLALQLHEHLKGNNHAPIHIDWRFGPDD